MLKMAKIRAYLIRVYFLYVLLRGLVLWEYESVDVSLLS